MLRILMHNAIAKGEDHEITQLLHLGRTSEHASIFNAPDGDNNVVDLDVLGSEDAELISLDTGDVDLCAILEPSQVDPEPARAEPPSIPEHELGQLLSDLERTSQALFPARHVIAAQDTGNLFPAVRAKPSRTGFDIFNAYRKKK
jgi:hypothetical protein